MKKKFLHNIAQFVCHHPKTIVAVSIALAIVSLIYASTSLKFDTDQDNLISNKLEYHQRYKKFLSEFGDWEYIYAVFEAPKGKENRAKNALLSLVDKIKGREDLFKEINFKEDVSLFENRALLILPPEDFHSLTDNLNRWAPDINRLVQSGDYADLLSFVADQLNLPASTLEKNSKDLETGFNLFKIILEGIDKPEKISEISRSDLFHPLIGRKFHIDPDGFFFTPNGHLLFCMIMPFKDYSTTTVIEKPLNFLRSQMDLVRGEYPDIKMGATGRPVLQADEMTTSSNDSIWASLVSLLGVSLIFMYFFRQAGRPLMAIASLLCGISWSTGFVTLTLGHLNLLTIVFAIILTGLGVDYGIHFIIRYQKERLEGKNGAQAVEKTILTSAGAIFTGAITTAIAFLAALFTDFLGLKELGFVAGSGILFCLVSQTITLSSFLLILDQKIKNELLLIPPSFKWLDFILKRPKTILTGVIVLTILSLPIVFRVHFEHNLLKLQNPGLESVEFERKISEESDYSTWFAAFLNQDKNAIRQIENKLSQLESVGQTESINTFVPSDQEERIKTLKQLKNAVIRPATFEVKFPNPEKLIQSLKKFKSGLERVQELAFEGGKGEAVEEIDVMIDTADKLHNKLVNHPLLIISRIQESQKTFFSLFHSTVEEFYNNLSPLPLKEKDLPSTIKKRFISKEGNYVAYAYPSENIWQPEFMAKFIEDIRSVDPFVTGSPVSVYESSTRMKRGFYLVGIITIIVVLIILLIDFGRLRETFIASLPLISGILWLVVFMGLFGIDLNLANFFALPILIGVGIDSGVHLVHRFRETGSASQTLHSISPALIPCALTTAIGFGTLSFVRHKGLASFGQIMMIGSMTCLAASLLIVPAVLKIIGRENSE